MGRSVLAAGTGLAASLPAFCFLAGAGSLALVSPAAAVTEGARSRSRSRSRGLALSDTLGSG